MERNRFTLLELMIARLVVPALHARWNLESQPPPKRAFEDLIRTQLTISPDLGEISVLLKMLTLREKAFSNAAEAQRMTEVLAIHRHTRSTIGGWYVSYFRQWDGAQLTEAHRRLRADNRECRRRVCQAGDGGALLMLTLSAKKPSATQPDGPWFEIDSESMAITPYVAVNHFKRRL